jgi:LrgB-like family
MDRLAITHPVSRGLALGTISHGQGTAQAASESELSGAVAGVAMGLGAVCTSLAAPWIVPLLAQMIRGRSVLPESSKQRPTVFTARACSPTIDTHAL